MNTISDDELFKQIKQEYIINNLSMQSIANKLNIKFNTIRRIIKKYNIKKSKELIVKSTEQTNLEKYGVKSTNQLDSVKNKVNKTKLEKYGTRTYNNPEKYKQTCLEKYGVDHTSKLKENRNKVKKTNLYKYNDENYNNRKQSIKTCLEKYNCNNVNQTNISNKTLKIISNKENLYNFIINNNIKHYHEIHNLLSDLSISCINKYIRNYELTNLFNNSFTQSKGEFEIRNLLNDLNVTYETNKRKYLNDMELDIYISELNLGIEFNGTYWHSNIYKDKKYHQIKSLKAQEKGIFIYHIFEYEWNDDRKKQIIISQLKNLIHKTENKIYARKCTIKEINIKQCRDFLDKNHLQGYRNSKIKLGLFYENELVSCMTFGKSFISHNKYEWELYRFCNKLNMTVPGGFNKLFQYFIKNYNPNEILTYSDFAKGMGKVYEKINFKKLTLTSPNYIWTNFKDIKQRYQCQMKNENIIMENKGYYKLFDCGSYKWIWNKGGDICTKNILKV